MTVDLTDPIFNDEDAARAHFEAIRWPTGRTCPHCGTVGNSTLMQGRTTRAGLYNCRDCRKPFTATMGTVYERSHIPLHKWLLATHLLCASKKGISSHQLWRMLNFGSYRTAWFMAHRIREAMKARLLPPMGGEGKVVEADETYIGNVEKSGKDDVFVNGKGWVKRGGGHVHKHKIVALVERGGPVRSIQVEHLTANAVAAILSANVDTRSRLMTDESNVYRKIGREFASHDTVNHSKDEYVRYDRAGMVHSNTIEGVFSIFKRGMRGVYQHCSEAHLHRYLAEFDFRYSERIALGVDDTRRAEKALAGAVGRRLMYKKPDGQPEA